MKDSFVFYRSFYESIKELDKDIQLEIYNAICEYSFNDELSELSPVAKALFTMIKVNIDNAMKRYNASVENGKNGGRPKSVDTDTVRKLLSKKMTIKEIADKTNCSERTIYRIKKEIDKIDKTKPKPNQNLNYNYNYNDNYNVNYNNNINYNENENINKDNSSSNILSFPPKDETEILKDEFEKLWRLYPKKVGKEKSFNKYKKYRTSKNKDEYCTYDEVLTGLNKYLKYIKQNSWYSPKDGSTWFNNRCWSDDYIIKEDNVSEWFDKEIKKEVISTQEEEELDELLKEYR